MVSFPTELQFYESTRKDIASDRKLLDGNNALPLWIYWIYAHPATYIDYLLSSPNIGNRKPTF